MGEIEAQALGLVPRDPDAGGAGIPEYGFDAMDLRPDIGIAQRVG